MKFFQKVCASACAVALCASPAFIAGCSSSSSTETTERTYQISEPVEDSPWADATEEDFANASTYMASIVPQLGLSVTSASFACDKETSTISVDMTTASEESQSRYIAQDASVICRLYSYAVAAAHVDALETSIEAGEVSEDDVADELDTWEGLVYDEELILEQLIGLQTSNSQETTDTVASYLQEAGESGGLYDAYSFSGMINSTSGMFFLVGDRLAGTDKSWMWQ